MKKGWIIGLPLIMTGIWLTGCGNAIPEMTMEQQELVVEFAASELLKYDVNYQSKLTAHEPEQQHEEEQGEQPKEPLIEEETLPEEIIVNTDVQNTESVGVPASDVTIVDNTGTVEAQNISIADFLDLTGVEISYAGYETVDTYPEGEAKEAYFFMSATEGNKLLVLQFSALNVSGEELSIDLAKSQTRYKIILNGTEKNALTTMLLNDMAYYQGTLAANESIELVLLCEIQDDQTEFIDTLQLKMKSVDDSATISLN